VGSQFGLGDTVHSFFFSPKQPTANGVIWGIGPVLLLPTGTDDLLSAEQWGLGPTGVAPKQDWPWTCGVLFNHIWSVAENGSRPDVSTTFLQPFLSYTAPDAWTFTLQTETTFDWEREQWMVPINALASKVVKFGDQLVSIGAGVRYWADGPPSSLHGWGMRMVVTLLSPGQAGCSPRRTGPRGREPCVCRIEMTTGARLLAAALMCPRSSIRSLGASEGTAGP
jgi:hypothetical protein